MSRIVRSVKGMSLKRGGTRNTTPMTYKIDRPRVDQIKELTKGIKSERGLDKCSLDVMKLS
mgnify:FL=1|jgi:hypothetical protein